MTAPLINHQVEQHPIYKNGVVPFLNLKDFLAVPRDCDPKKTRVYIPPPGQFLQQTTRNGIVIRLEHRPDEGLFLIIGDDLVYPVIAQPRRRLHNQVRIPARYVLRDSLGHNVEGLFLHAPSSSSASRYELDANGIWFHRSYHEKADRLD